MYVYLYDAFVKTGPYARVMNTIENRLTDLELTGKMVKLAPFTNPKAILYDELRNGAKTAIIIGDENTFSRVITRCADVDMVFGWIPVGRQVAMSEYLGIPYGADACQVVNARRIVGTGVLQVNDRYAIGEMHIPMTKLWLSIDGMYAMGPTGDGMEVAVCNLRILPWCKDDLARVQPTAAAQLLACIRPMAQEKRRFWQQQFSPLTVVPFVRMTVYSKTPFEMFLDGQRSKETRITIAMAGHRIRLITGKKRAIVAS